MSYPETVQFFENDTLIAQAEGSPGFGPLTYNSPLTIHGAEYWTRSISVEIVAVNGDILSRMIRRVDVVKVLSGITTGAVLRKPSRSGFVSFTPIDWRSY